MSLEFAPSRRVIKQHKCSLRRIALGGKWPVDSGSLWLMPPLSSGRIPGWMPYSHQDTCFCK